LKVTNGKTALKRLQQLLDKRRQSLTGEVIDLDTERKKRQAPCVRTLQSLSQVSDCREEDDQPDWNE
jgi:hypothetical protein